MNRYILLGGVFSAALAWVPIALADSPREFIQKALEGDNSEIMLGRLAAEQARSPAVRDFGNRLVTDHRQALDDVRQLGGRFGLQPSREVASEAKDERDKLAGLRGRDFDREFVRYMVDDHRKDIDDFRDEAREHHGPVSDLAQRELPTLREHLRMAIALGKSDGRSSRGGEMDPMGGHGDEQRPGDSGYGAGWKGRDR
jgi:putative membrane protein